MRERERQRTRRRLGDRQPPLRNGRTDASRAPRRGRSIARRCSSTFLPNAAWSVRGGRSVHRCHGSSHPRADAAILECAATGDRCPVAFADSRSASAGPTPDGPRVPRRRQPSAAPHLRPVSGKHKPHQQLGSRRLLCPTDRRRVAGGSQPRAASKAGAVGIPLGTPDRHRRDAPLHQAGRRDGHVQHRRHPDRRPARSDSQSCRLDAA